jgi:hypothetical protein
VEFGQTWVSPEAVFLALGGLPASLFLKIQKHSAAEQGKLPATGAFVAADEAGRG